MTSLLVWGGALSWSQEPAPAPAPTPAPSPAATAPSTSGTTGSTPAADENVTWQTDAQGREYRTEKLKKSLPHLRLEDGRLRTAWGITVDIAGEDETDFFVKVYKPVELPPPPPKGLTPEQKAEVAAAYRFDTKVVETLRFEPFDQGLPQSGQWRNKFAVADMNGDGHLDIVHGPPRKHPTVPVIFLGDGKGTWRRWAEASFPKEGFDYGAAAVADFDGDKRPDIALGMHLRGITVLRNEGNGAFSALREGLDPIGDRQTPAFSSRALTTLDWDRDGRMDILALGEGPRLALTAGTRASSGSSGVVLYRNLGKGAWEKKHGGGRVFGDAVAVGKIARGETGFVTATSVRGLREVLFSRGGDPFKAEELPGLRPGALVHAVAVADFDGNGRDDVAVGHATYEGEQWRSGIDVLTQDRDGTWTRQTVYAEDGSMGITTLATGDLNRDGRPDLVGLTGDGRVLIFTANRSGAFERAAAELAPPHRGCRGYHVAVTDIDKDGHADIVAAFAGESEGMATLRNPGCPGEGSLRAWRTVSRAEPMKGHR